MNPFTESVDRKSYLIWNIVLSLADYVVYFSVDSRSLLITFGVASLLLSLLVIARRLQNTGLTMWLLLALLLPIANILLLIALFFIPPRVATASSSNTGASRGFKITIGIIISLFLILCTIVGVGLTH